MDMDPLRIKAESPQFVVGVFHTLSDSEANEENQEYEVDPLEVEIEQPEFVTNGFQHFGENGVRNDNQENGHFSSELTLISVSFF